MQSSKLARLKTVGVPGAALAQLQTQCPHDGFQKDSSNLAVFNMAGALGGGGWGQLAPRLQHNVRMVGFKKTRALRRLPMCRVEKHSHALKQACRARKSRGVAECSSFLARGRLGIVLAMNHVHGSCAS